MCFLQALWVLPRFKNMHHRLIYDSKLSLGLDVSVWVVVIYLCGPPMAGDPHTGCIPLSSNSSWDKPRNGSRRFLKMDGYDDLDQTVVP